MIVSIISQKGGVSKSTIATNLAAYAHLHGQRSVIADLDKMRTATDWEAERRKWADQNQTTSPLEGLEVKQPKTTGPLVVGWLLQLGKEFDFVAVDCPGDLCAQLEYAAAVADVVVMPARPGGADIWAMRETIDKKITDAEAKRAKEGRKAAPRLIVVTQAVDGTRNKREALQELRNYGEVLEDAVLHHRQVYTDALSMGESVFTLEPDGAAAVEVEAIFQACVKAAHRQTRRKA